LRPTEQIQPEGGDTLQSTKLQVLARRTMNILQSRDGYNRDLAPFDCSAVVSYPDPKGIFPISGLSIRVIT
jgi:hypothetical protein